MNAILKFLLSALATILLILLMSRFIRRREPSPNNSIDQLFSGRRSYDDTEFYGKFYYSSGIPAEIPLRLRKLFERILGVSMSRLEPHDMLFDVYEQIDPHDVLHAVHREFQLVSRAAEPSCTEWSFDSIVRYVAKNVS